MPEAPWAIERTVDGDGTPIFIREAGDGPPVVLLHGFPQTGECWREVARLLSVDHRLIVPDLPGYARSGRPPAFDAGTIASTLVAAIRDAGVERATVVGHDWGGGIAYRVAGAHQDFTERLVIVNAPYGKVDLRKGWHMVAFNIPVLPELALTATRGALIPAMIRAGSVRKDAFDEDTMAHYREAFQPLERQRNALAYYRTITRSAVLGRKPKGSGKGKRITAPTLIVWGEDDPALPVSLTEGIARAIPGASVERIPDVGHFVPEEAPVALADAIRGFVRG